MSMKRRAFLGGLGAGGGLAVFSTFSTLSPFPALGRAAPARRSLVFDRLRDAEIDIRARAEYVSSKSAIASEAVELALKNPRGGRVASRDGNLAIALTPVAGRPDAMDVASTLRIAAPTRYFVALDFRAWSRNNYVVLPGACYAGNRFQSRRAAAYPPLLTERADIGPHVPPIIPAIPHLSAGEGPSSLAVDATDLAIPAIGIFMPAQRLGVIVMTELGSANDWTTFRIEEKDDRSGASVIIGAGPTGEPPGLRQRPERRRAPTTRDAVGRIAPRVHLFECADVPALFERLFALRKDLTGPTTLVNELPFSAAFARHEQRANARWVEKPGFLAVGERDSAYSTWQTGWSGGLASTLPLLAAGGKGSRERAAATIAFAIESGQAPSGFFHGVSDGKAWFDDGFAAPLPAPPPADGARPPPAPPVYKHARGWHLVRRTGEALTFLVKQLTLLERRPELRAGVNGGRWAEACRAAADALCKLWERHKQLGQFVDIDSGELIVGGSTSAGLAAAGLALAAAQLKEPRYLQTAKAIGEHHYERFVRAGLTCGGPGDALQTPDSQSAAALLDSFMTLYEATRDRVWIDRAGPRRTSSRHGWSRTTSPRARAAARASAERAPPARCSGAPRAAADRPDTWCRRATRCCGFTVRPARWRCSSCCATRSTTSPSTSRPRAAHRRARRATTSPGNARARPPRAGSMRARAAWCRWTAPSTRSACCRTRRFRESTCGPTPASCLRSTTSRRASRSARRSGSF